MQLEAMAKGIEEEIGRVEKENVKIREDLEIVMTTVKENRKNQNVSLIDMQKELENEETQLRRLKAHAAKKEALVVEW